jgi:hypothetical protein
MWFSSGSCGLIVVLYQVAGVLPAQTYDRSWPPSAEIASDDNARLIVHVRREALERPGGSGTE